MAVVIAVAGIGLGGSINAFCADAIANKAPVKHWGISPRTPDGGLIRFEGAEARPISATLWSVTELKLESYRPNGAMEIRVEAPQCNVDITTRTASSPGDLRVTKEDAGLLLTGTGFVYNDADKRLVVSNRVRVVIQTSLLRAQTQKNP